MKNSGVFTVKGRTSLMQLLAMAGGVDHSTASGEVVVFRTINGTRAAARFDTDAIRKGNANDPELQPGDVIVVDTSSTKLALSNIVKVLPSPPRLPFFRGCEGWIMNYNRPNPPEDSNANARSVVPAAQCSRHA